MIEYMTQILEKDCFVKYRSTEQVWEMAEAFSANNELFCIWMLDGRVFINGRTYS